MSACPVCGETKYGYGAWPVQFQCGYTVDQFGKNVLLCSRTLEVIAKLKARLEDK